MRPADSGRYPSGQRGQTVNLLAYAFGGSNPPLPTIVAGAFEAGFTEGGLRKVRLREARALTRFEAGALTRLRRARFRSWACAVSRLRRARRLRRAACRG